jgi:benzoylformate decarboxylase
VTVREATYEVLRRLGLTTIFSNPGSTEVPFLAGLPEDLTFVLGLHEGSVVAMAAGHAIGRDAPSLALLHSTPGLGNAVAALATARSNRAPLVVIVGQQDRRHLALDPFLAGRLHGLAGEYPVWSDQPARPQDVPGAIVRAYHEAETGRGPAIVIVPMDDWLEPAPEPHEVLGPERLLRSAAADPAAVAALTDLLAQAGAPAIVAGAGAGWARSPHWPSGSAAPSSRSRSAAGPASRRTIRCSPATCPPAARGCARCLPPTTSCSSSAPGHCASTRSTRARWCTPPPRNRPEAPPPPGPGEPLRAGHVLAALAERLPRDAILVEESPSSRPELHARVPATEPLGFVSAMGMLGFALPAAIGLRMARPDRPVLAVVGDGSSLYQIQALWSAARYRAGVLFVVLSNGGYAIMDRLAERSGAPGPWPRIDADICALARALGCDAIRVERHDELLERLDAELGHRDAPLVLEVAVAPDETFDP